MAAALNYATVFSGATPGCLLSDPAAAPPFRPHHQRRHGAGRQPDRAIRRRGGQPWAVAFSRRPLTVSGGASFRCDAMRAGRLNALSGGRGPELARVPPVRRHRRQASGGGVSSAGVE
jgi:hypothetical protein